MHKKIFQVGEDDMKYIKTENAIGHVLCHDITKIVPGEFKGTAFKKGHVIKSEDIQELLDIGKEHVYVWEKEEGFLHEDEAAYILRDLSINDGMSATEPKEGKIEIHAAKDGLLKIDTQKLMAINEIGEIIIASRHGDFPVKKGDVIAGMRVIPLVIKGEKLERAKSMCGQEPIFKILPFEQVKAGLVVTGSEVAKGRIKDAFGPIIKEKLAEYGIEVTKEKIVTDDKETIVKTIEDFIQTGVEMVLCTGGMSVDPDDQTPGAIKSLGADILCYGAPVLPGAMFLLAYKQINRRTIPIMGLPGCVMYAKRTIFDLVLPRVLACETIKNGELAAYGEGGLCLNCAVCNFPNCGFGK